MEIKVWKRTHYNCCICPSHFNYFSFILSNPVVRPGFKITFIQEDGIEDSVLSKQNILIHELLLREKIFSSILEGLLRMSLVVLRHRLFALQSHGMHPTLLFLQEEEKYSLLREQ